MEMTVTLKLAVCLALLAQIAPATGPAKDRVQFRLVAAEDDAAAEVVRVADPEGPEKELRLSRDVLLDGSHVEAAEARRGALGGWTVWVKFTEAGSKRLADATRANVGRRLAVVVDGAVVTAPEIRTEISGSAEISGGARGFEQARAEELAAAISAASRVPTTQPAR